MSALPLPSPSVASSSLCADGATAGDDRSSVSSSSPSVAASSLCADGATAGDDRSTVEPRKSSILKVTFEEVTLAADLWDAGAPLKTIADRLWWTDDLLKRVMRVAREGPDPGYFPEFPHRRPKERMAIGAPARPCHPADGSGLLSPDIALWRAALERQGIAASTVAARRVADHLPPDRFVDPTLCLPPEPVAALAAADTAPGCAAPPWPSGAGPDG
jgi:hypothetical protein